MNPHRSETLPRNSWITEACHQIRLNYYWLQATGYRENRTGLRSNVRQLNHLRYSPQMRGGYIH